MTTVDSLIVTEIDWIAEANEPYMHYAIVDGKTIRLRLNDFPDEPICTVFIDGKGFDIEEFPRPNWTLPAHRGEEPNIEKIEANRK